VECVSQVRINPDLGGGLCALSKSLGEHLLQPVAQ
jgi:hypothetical protein